MPVAQSFAAARNALRFFSNPDACIDTAAVIHADASASVDDRAEAAILCARGMMDKGMDSDSLAWLDRVPSESAHVATADAYRAYLHHRRSERDLAIAAADRAGQAAATIAPGAAFYRAFALSALDRRADAIAALTPVLDDAQWGPPAMRERGRWRMEAGQRADGIADLQAAAGRGNKGAAQMLSDHSEIGADAESQLAHANFLADSYAQGAIDTLAGFLAKRTDTTAAQQAKANAALAAIQLKSGNHDEAVAASERAIGLDATNRGLLAEHGWLLCNVGRAVEGYDLIARAAAMPGGTSDEELATDAKVAGYLGDACYALGHSDVGIAAFDRAFANAPRQPVRMRRYATMLDRLGRTAAAATWRLAAAIAGDETAIDECRGASVMLPATLHDAGCNNLARGGNPAIIVEQLAEAVALWTQHSRAWGDFCARHAAMASSNLAFAYNLAGNLEAAVAAGRAAVDARPGFRDGWLNYGNQLAAMGELKPALAAFERAEWCDASYAASHYGRSDALRRLGHGAASIAALERAAAIRYENPIQQRDVHWRLARAYHATGRYDDARAQWARVAELEDRDPEESAEVSALAAIGEMAAAGATELEPMPYRRYGFRPVEWHASDRLAMRLHFATPPDEATRTELEAIIEGVIDDSPEIPGEVAFSGPFAIVTLEADPEDDLPMEGFETLSAIADAVHEIAPLVEIVAYNAVGLSEGDMGELWSIAQQPMPDAGPESTYHVAFWPFRFADTTRWDAFPPKPAAEPEDHE